MCSGGRLLADFVAGVQEVPDLPEPVAQCVTWTIDGVSVVLAHKVARSVFGGSYVPLTGGEAYPADAVAKCRFRLGHDAPDPLCMCGFHALSSIETWELDPASRFVHLDVALTGRVLAFEFAPGAMQFSSDGEVGRDQVGVLFRAARQTVISLPDDEWSAPRTEAWLAAQARRAVRPDGLGGVRARRRGREPRGSGPVRLTLPNDPAVVVEVVDDAGYCHTELHLAPTGADVADPVNAWL